MDNGKTIYVLEMVKRSIDDFGPFHKIVKYNFLVGAFTNKDEAYKTKAKLMKATEKNIGKDKLRMIDFNITAVKDGEMININKSILRD